jgi:hypothetical protein
MGLKREHVCTPRMHWYDVCSMYDVCSQGGLFNVVTRVAHLLRDCNASALPHGTH